MQRHLLLLLATTTTLGASLVSAQDAQVHVQIEVVDQDSADVVDESEVPQEEALPPPPDQVVYAQPAPAQPVYAQPAPAYAQPTYGVQLQQDLVLRQRLSEYRLGGPIAMAATGLALGVIFLYSAAIVYDVSGCFGGGCVPNRRGTAILGTISAAGFSLAIIGTAMLIKRVINRARIRREFNSGVALEDGALFRF